MKSLVQSHKEAQRSSRRRPATLWESLNFDCDEVKLWCEGLEPTTEILACFRGSISWIVYLGLIGYLIGSVVMLVRHHKMRHACAPVYNIWLYILLSLIFAQVTGMAATFVQSIKAARRILNFARKIGVAIIALAFGSYGTGVIATAQSAHIRNKDACAGDRLPPQFVQLAYATMFIAWIVFLYQMLTFAAALLMGYRFIEPRLPKYVRLGLDESAPDHDPDLIAATLEQASAPLDKDDAKKWEQSSAMGASLGADSAETQHMFSRYSKMVDSEETTPQSNIYRPKAAAKRSDEKDEMEDVELGKFDSKHSSTITHRKKHQQSLLEGNESSDMGI